MCAGAVGGGRARGAGGAQYREAGGSWPARFASQGREAFAVAIDLASADSIKEAFAKTAKEFGRSRFW